MLNAVFSRVLAWAKFTFLADPVFFCVLEPSSFYVLELDAVVSRVLTCVEGGPALLFVLLYVLVVLCCFLLWSCVAVILGCRRW